MIEKESDNQNNPFLCCSSCLKIAKLFEKIETK